MSLYSKHIYIFLFAIISYSYTTQGQVKISSQKNIPFTILKTTDDNLNIDAILNAQSDFKLAETFSEKTHPNDAYWIRLDFLNETKNQKANTLRFLKFNAFEYGTLYYTQNNTLKKKPIGRFDYQSIGELFKADKYFAEAPFSIAHLIDNRYLFLEVKRTKFFENTSSWEFMFSEKSTKDLYNSNDLKAIISIYFFGGLSAIMCILMLVFFFYLKRYEFLLYSLYAFFLLIYLTKDEIQLFYTFLKNNELLTNWALENVAILVGLSYMLFAICYLEIKRDYHFAYQVLKMSIGIHIIGLLIDIIFYFTNYYIGHLYFLKYFPILDSVTAFIAFGYILLNIKNRISLLFVIGSIIFMLGVGYYFYFNNDIDPLHYNKQSIVIGSSIELMIFAFALAYKVHIEHIEKMNFQKEAFVNKTKALRAQINPHFIFNSLSSIQHLVTKNDKVASLKYLTKFSRLTRNILESSIESSVILADEIKMLKDYLELESLRFEDSFSYNITVEDALEINTIEVPILIIQPFVENAILHGLLNKTNGTKELTIAFKQESNYLICTVDDNGIGRENSSKNKRTHKNKSRGLEVTKERLQMVNDSDNNIEIIDKVDTNNVPQGTTVIIKINLA